MYAVRHESGENDDERDDEWRWSGPNTWQKMYLFENDWLQQVGYKLELIRT
jgi:hypothetical protein